MQYNEILVYKFHYGAIMRVIDYLSARRKQLNYTLDNLRDKTGLGNSHLSRLLSGHMDVRLSNVEALASALDAELIVVPKEIASEVHQFIASKGQLTRPDSKSAAESFLEKS